MKRTSKTYVAYLEALALSLLAERNSERDIVGIDWQGKPCTYSPLNAKTLIQTVRDTDLLG
jgi:hypothetical protein